MPLGVHAQQLPVRGDDLCGQHIIDREAVLAHQVAHPAAQGDTPYPDRADIAETGCEAVGSHSSGVLARSQPRIGPGCAPFGVDLEVLHLREVEHYAPF